MQKTFLLLDDYSSIDAIRECICTNPIYPLDPVLPTARYRGTVIASEDDGEAVTIIGWQRNSARLQKVDVSLPTIITATLSYDRTEQAFIVRSVDLDNRFRGSKGILCSASYLDRRLKSELVGMPFDATLLKKTRIDAMHCFHLAEVLGGMICYLGIVKDRLRKVAGNQLLYEEEVLDSLPGVDESTDFRVAGRQKMHGRQDLSYTLTLSNLLESVRFSNDGTMSCAGELGYEFSIAEAAKLSGSLSFDGSTFLHIGFQKMLLSCIRMVQTAFGIDVREKYLCTNLCPAALIGLLTQAMAIRRFSNNYNYIMHALTAIQRHDGMPLCIGAASSPAEMKQRFPAFTQKDLKG